MSIANLIGTSCEAMDKADGRAEKGREKADRLYLFELKLEGEIIIKCGKSSGKSSVDRFFSILYDYARIHRGTPESRIIRDVECEDVFKKENKFHTYFNDNRFFPINPFSGSTELFNITIEEAMLKFDEIIGESIDRSTVKKCHKCNEIKSTIKYTTNKAKKDGLSHICKQCTKVNQRSKKSIYTRMYANQVEHSKTRGHPRPAYTSKDLKEWLDNNSDFDALYEGYERSGYNRTSVPSVDRINSELPYTMDNIRLMSFSDNMKLNMEYTRNTKGRDVTVFDIDNGMPIMTCTSLNEACLQTNKSNKLINRKISSVNKHGRLNRMGNFGYIYTEDVENFTDSNGILLERLLRKQNK